MDSTQTSSTASLTENSIAGSQSNYVEIASDIVSAYVSNNSIPVSEIATLIRDIHASLVSISQGGSTAQSMVEEKPLVPAVNPKKSITDDYLICLNDGKSFKSLKRHLRAQYNISPEQYRAMWKLPADYPMVAPNYAKARSNLAKQMGLGSGRKNSDAAPSSRARKQAA